MIDSRIFPLLETLAAHNLDWLVREILATIEMGNTRAETDEAVSLAQRQVRDNEDVRYEGEDYAEPVFSRAWRGDEQIKIAAKLSVSRIKETLYMAQGSLEAISSIIGAYDGEGIYRSAEGVVFAADDLEPESALDGRSVELAIQELDLLHFAVEEWKAEMLGEA